MATWDGSYHGSGDTNYYFMYSDQNNPNNTPNWNYYSQNRQTNLFNNGPNMSVSNGSMIFNQNQAVFAHGIPNTPQFLPPIMSREQMIPQFQSPQLPPFRCSSTHREPISGVHTLDNKYVYTQQSQNFDHSEQSNLAINEVPLNNIARVSYTTINNRQEITVHKGNKMYNNSKNVANDRSNYFQQSKRNANSYKRTRNVTGSGRFYSDKYNLNTQSQNMNHAGIGDTNETVVASTSNYVNNTNSELHNTTEDVHYDKEIVKTKEHNSSNKLVDNENKKQENQCDSNSRNSNKRTTEKYASNQFRDKKGKSVNKDRQPYQYNREYKFVGIKEKDKRKDTFKETWDRGTTNWRRKIEYDNKFRNPKRNYNRKQNIDDDASQRERLTDQLNKGQLECLVCCEFIRQVDSIWSCSNCYHVLHLKCVKKWATSSQDDNGWRCPACQNISTFMPEDYYCFCGKTKMPEWNRRDIAHSCGEVCGRNRLKNNCVHKCTLLCHPGSCPLCIAMVTKHCGCGKLTQTLKCSTATLLYCNATCDKPLNCGKHMCTKKCHHGECGPCDGKVQQNCFCGKNKRDMPCESNTPSTYGCGDICGKLLDCGNHKCAESCHPGPCSQCTLKPEIVTHCCCQQTPLRETRESCLDPIPICDKICSKRLKCGQPSTPHTCKKKCHEGSCPECDLNTMVKCRCGNMDKEIPCKELTTKADDARCEKKCTKKRSCGKHKCNQMCCIDIEHICPLPCSKTLSCGRHKCEQTCHKGRCQPCWRSSFDELYCECGAAVIYPPVPCGTRRPICDMPCSRQHSCDHEVLHNCHSEPTCPPCSVLTQRWCYGKHELRKAVPCYVKEISCGLPCNKPLSCQRHKCIITCHPGPCEKSGQVCTQPCTTPRDLCGHVCASPCHEGKCPDTPCKEMVKVTCQCGHRSMSRVCAENAREYHRIASGILASKMADMQLGHSVDLDEVFGQNAKKQNQLKTLECNEECKIIERNRKLALGLQIANPDLSGKLMPRYSEFMRQWAKKDPQFCQLVHDKLTELVQLAKTSKHKSRSYSFDIMNREKRHFVHESCEHFGCESQAYDKEPKRNVVATAVKDKCWLPSYSLLEIIQRESGQRKVPGPMLKSTKAVNSTRNADVLPLNARKSQKPSSTPVASSSKFSEFEIDYFDYQGP